MDEATEKTAPEAEEDFPVFLRMREVTARTTLSRTTILRQVENGLFPAPVAITDSRWAWIENEVIAWQRERIASRRAA